MDRPNQHPAQRAHDEVVLRDPETGFEFGKLIVDRSNSLGFADPYDIGCEITPENMAKCHPADIKRCIHKHYPHSPEANIMVAELVRQGWPIPRGYEPKRKSALWIFLKGVKWFAWLHLAASIAWGLGWVALLIWANFHFTSFEQTFLPLTDFEALDPERTKSGLTCAAIMLSWPWAFAVIMFFATCEQPKGKTWREAKKEAQA